MQESMSYNSGQIYTARPRSMPVVTVMLSLLTAVLIVGSLFWIQWAGQRSIALRYPVPRVQLNVPSSATPLIRGQNYQFSVAASGRELSYFWDFGDQSSSYGNTTNHAYQTNGSFNVTLSVTDPAGHNITQSMAFTVVPPLPQASFTISYGYGGYVYFDASSSAADSSTSLASYIWDLGDGTTGSTAYQQVSHAYSYTGVYQVSLTVVDATGQRSNVYTGSVTIS